MCYHCAARLSCVCFTSCFSSSFLFFFFNDTATPEIYTLSLHDALPICVATAGQEKFARHRLSARRREALDAEHEIRSEEHTSELQSLTNLVCRLLLEKKKKK